MRLFIRLVRRQCKRDRTIFASVRRGTGVLELTVSPHANDFADLSPTVSDDQRCQRFRVFISRDIWDGWEIANSPTV